MTKKTYGLLVVNHLQWSVIGLFVALSVAFISLDYGVVVYGAPAAESAVSEILAPLSPPAPAAAPQKPAESVVPDTINGELVWPDPWDEIADYPLRNY